MAGQGGDAADPGAHRGEQGEVEIGLADRYRISPQIASAMRAVPGVVEVELV